VPRDLCDRPRPPRPRLRFRLITSPGLAVPAPPPDELLAPELLPPELPSARELEDEDEDKDELDFCSGDDCRVPSVSRRSLGGGLRALSACCGSAVRAGTGSPKIGCSGFCFSVVLCASSGAGFLRRRMRSLIHFLMSGL
jgi:hypothetical protein